MLQIYSINIFISLLTICQILSSPIPDQIEYNDREQLDYPNQVDNIENFRDIQIKNDVEQTITQVQQMLEGDPNLPRLTKGEIEDLFEQVTREEYEKSLEEGDTNRAEHMRALMLVLPYNTDNNSKQNLEELFNRPPVTKVVASSEPKPRKPLRPVYQPSGKVEIISIGNPNMQPTTYKPTFRRKITLSTPTPITTYHPQQSFSRSTIDGSVDDLLSDNFEVISIGGNKKQLNQFINKSNYPKKFDLIAEIQSTETTEKPQRFSSHYNAKTLNFQKDIYHNSAAPAENSRKTTTTKNHDLEDVLHSLGFPTQTQSRRHFKFQEDFSDSKIPKPIISSLIKQDRVLVDEPNPVNIEDFTKSLVPQPKIEAFSTFKPLNLQSSAQIEPGLEEYLIKFGILESGRNSRSQKVLNAPPKIEKILPSTIITTTTTTTTEKNKLDNIKRIDTNINESIVDGTNTFNPTQTDKDDFQELGRLLKNIRDLQELRVNLTADNLNKLDIKNYNLSDSLLAQGPNPIDMPEFGDLQKNEVKRQEDDTTETAPTRFSLSLDDSDLPADSSSLNLTSNNDSPTTTSDNDSAVQITTELNSAEITTTEESPNGSLSDLEDSFGKLDPVTEKPLPPPRQNGFYFLADINSFLEVGDGEEKVVVRFNPQIGDPSRFIPVKVP